MMSVLVEHYPFPPIRGEPLRFNNVNKLRQWISDVEYIANQLHNALYMSQSLMYEAMKVNDDFIKSFHLLLCSKTSYERTL